MISPKHILWILLIKIGEQSLNFGESFSKFGDYSLEMEVYNLNRNINKILEASQTFLHLPNLVNQFGVTHIFRSRCTASEKALDDYSLTKIQRIKNSLVCFLLVKNQLWKKNCGRNFQKLQKSNQSKKTYFHQPM